MCEKGEEVVLDLPAEIDEGKENRTITADKCCADVLKHLWDNGIDTRGHCCGHGECNPSIVVPEGYYRIAIARTLILIEQVDNRKWDILQWQLTKVNWEKADKKLLAVRIGFWLLGVLTLAAWLLVVLVCVKLFFGM